MLLGLSAVAAAASPALEITVDPRIELVAAVSLLAGDRPGWTPREVSPYRARLVAFAEPHRGHPAVAVMREIRGFAYSYPAEAILHFGPPPGLEPLAPMSKQVLDELGGQAALDRWVDSLRRFARDTDFMAFFAAERPEFDRMTARTRDTIGGLDIPAAFETYYGLPPQRYTLVLGPNLLPGAFGPSVPLPDGTRHYYSVQGAAGVVDGFPHFGSRASIASLTWHEFGHSVVNPLTATNRAKLDESEPLYRAIRKDMKKAAYGSWEIAANELLVRAAAMRIAARELSGDEAFQAIATQHTPSPLVNFYAYRASDLLETFYERGRERWKDYAAFYPVNLLMFRSLSVDAAER